jgi:predicted nucleotidyltransferase component of viral defense system
MISDDALLNLHNRYQTTDLNIRREYIQHLFLSYFYQQPQTNQIFFKGGTALRLIYKSPRFSEDLDFGSTLHDVNEIEKALLDRHKPRDFYDLYFLLQKDMISPKQKDVLREALSLVTKTNINFRQELEQFLPQSHSQVIKDFKAVLERTIKKSI